MATRYEEINNLRTMQNELRVQESLQEKIKNEKQRIEKERERTIADYPKYQSQDYEKAAKKTKERNLTKKGMLTFGIIGGAFKIWALVMAISEIERSSDAFIVWLAVAAVAYYGFFAVVKKTKRRYADKILLIQTGYFLALCALDAVLGCFCKLMGQTSYLYQVLSNMCFTSAMAALGTAVVGGIVILILTASEKKKTQAAIAAAKRKDAAHLAEYERQKAEGEIVIAQQRAALKAEIQNNVARMEENIRAYRQGILNSQRVLESTPGLAMQDKNMYTVSTILSYFERGKIDSIKEGINLFDMEERQRSAARAAAVAAAERTAALNSWIKSQQDTLDTMAENQRRHNERMEEEARRATEKIDREIDRLNNR